MTKKSNLMLEQIVDYIQETKHSKLKEQVTRYIPQVRACKEGFVVSDGIDFSGLKLSDDSEVDLDLLKIYLFPRSLIIPAIAPIYSLSITSPEGEIGNLGKFIYQDPSQRIKMRLLSKLPKSVYDSRVLGIYEAIGQFTIYKQKLPSFKDIAIRNLVKGIEHDDISL